MNRSLRSTAVLALGLATFVANTPHAASAQSSLSLPATELASGIPVTGVASRNALALYGISVDVPSRLMFDLTGGTDPQIFLAKDRLPSLTDWDVRVGFGFPALNYQVAVDSGEWYIGVRDVNLDIPFPAETYTLVATLQDASLTPPLAFNLSTGGRRETSSREGEMQYFTIATPEVNSVVDLATGERFGSGNVDLFVALDRFPRIDTNGAIVDYSLAAAQPGNLEKVRLTALPPNHTIVVAMHGFTAPGYENVFLGAVTTHFDSTNLANNRDVRVTGTTARHFRISVPPGQIRLTFQTSGGTGGSHISGKLNEPIVSSSIFPDVTADFLGADDPRKPNDSTIVIPNPAPGDYYFLLEPDDSNGYSNLTVKARFRDSL